VPKKGGTEMKLEMRSRETGEDLESFSRGRGAMGAPHINPAKEAKAQGTEVQEEKTDPQNTPVKQPKGEDRVTFRKGSLGLPKRGRRPQ